jgi:hypothetical protein
MRFTQMRKQRTGAGASLPAHLFEPTAGMAS